MDQETHDELVSMAGRWHAFAVRAFEANGPDDRYGRGLQICAEQLTGALERLTRDQAALGRHVQRTCPGGC